ncbi:penicillin-binding protein 2 [bacterium]|nr:penicillin-binding protein 2 [bacterium]
MRNWEKGFKKRTSWIASLFVIAFIALIGNLFELQVIRHSYYKKIVEKMTVKKKEIQPHRGTIYDRKQRVLAVELLGGSIFLRPDEVKDANLLMCKLSPALSLKEDDLIKKLLGPNSVVALKRNINYTTFQKVKKIVEDYNISGIELQVERKRVYPNGYLLSHVLGFLDIDQNPLEGCERVFDRYLGGKKGIIESAYDVRGNPIPNLTKVIQNPQDGDNIILTINLDIQRIVEEELDKAYQQLKPQCAIAIVMDPRNGDILALANRPTFDPNEQAKYPNAWKRNRAATDVYEVGSVLKPIIIASALQEGIITPSSRFYCSGKLKVNNRTISCVVHHSGGHGSVNPEKIIEVSCNVGAAQVGLKMGAKRLYETLKKFGFDKPITDEILGAAPGMIPPLKDWDSVRIANVSFGQGVAITPLHLISAFCSLVNGGILYKPRILKAVVQNDGKIRTFKPEVISQPISPEVSNLIRNMMEKVVSGKEGTARNYANIEGIKVGGKTGTAQKVINGVFTDEVVASFVGFLPVSNPRLVILVLIDQPQTNRWGATAAAPVFKQIAKRSLACLGINPQLTQTTLNTLQAVAPQRSHSFEKNQQ